jgi:ribonuclease BN (tRNA processing enzyme)
MELRYQTSQKIIVAVIYRQVLNYVLTSITYIISISDSSNVWLVDCGDAEGIINYLQDNNKILSGIFLTHTHYDHTKLFINITSYILQRWFPKEGRNYCRFMH